ncbi:YqjF family protein [Tuwongella immobilis]|uniref:DUF2071 domain-containing protein n=1 Tax=Tuwongella immobilis TaxID=692036 RepID=A0A6C2YW96_9BACT|nr:DUF2071 domain-containing protein [Tuwongella immobilis]VIP05229.1 Putative uncharacterized protein OS=Verrucomicrobiae bacterium DG1235 GN=VDG1235_1228 PE=4 SV=1: DUF2071 [Tuwongella immobilis]VTS07814.1 Putative uncharacterized protein OS=Verrucomicrobiae bacterium DG1235 GN=VDG1235_1228 PE=4 SV=1: DUF2071 [Tuwongella immobilis]
MHPALSQLDHRPWPLPAKPWTWRQRWSHLLFAHWPVPAAVLQPLVPEPLVIQEFAGTSWVGIVPFEMSGVTRWPFPPMPGLSAFPELNLRLYVEYHGKPGVWFLSLDAANAIAVWAARTFFHLPYVHAKMSTQREGEWFHYHSQRYRIDPPLSQPVTVTARYRPIGPVRRAQPHTLEHFLLERYCLFARSPRGRWYCGEIHHHPWPVQSAEAELDAAQLAAASGIQLDGPPPQLHYCSGVEVAVWDLQRITEAPSGQ